MAKCFFALGVKILDDTQNFIKKINKKLRPNVTTNHRKKELLNRLKKTKSSFLLRVE